MNRGGAAALTLLVGCSSGATGAPISATDAGAPAKTDATSQETGGASDATRDASPGSHDAVADAAGDAFGPHDAPMTVDAALKADATANACSVDGNPGECMTVSACAATPSHTSTAGYCSGPASIECCTETPSVADNPPIPAGYMLMQQSQVTPAMTTWAVAILNDPAMYPMFSTATKVFGTLTVLARVEWHPPDFQNSVVHRGVTLYVPV